MAKNTWKKSLQYLLQVVSYNLQSSFFISQTCMNEKGTETYKFLKSEIESCSKVLGHKQNFSPRFPNF